MELIRTCRERLASERGSVGVVVALVIFLAMGMLTMTWNTAQLSKAKMRLQNAADSAALAHAVWQARGMNAVQNINDEMYEALALAVKLRNIAIGVEIAAQAFDVASNAPFVGIIFKGLAIVFHTVGILSGGASGWMATKICDWFLKYIQLGYEWGSAWFGVWNAMQLAAQNGADPLAALNFGSSSTADYDSWNLGLYALPCLSAHPKDIVFLPLGESKKDEVGKSPWKEGDKTTVFNMSSAPWKSIYSFTGAGKAWELKPRVSRRGNQEGLKVEDGKVKDDDVLPSPTVWIAFKLDRHVHTLPIDAFYNKDDSKGWTHDVPLFASAAAQCITGDVVPHSKKTEEDKTNQRPSGFGAGATAKLVPVSLAGYKLNKAVGVALDAISFH